MPLSLAPRLSPALRPSPEELRSWEALGLQPIAADDVRRTVAALVLQAGTSFPEDYYRALRMGWEREQNPVGRGIYRQLLRNAALATAAGRPTCQDTGQAVVFVDLGQQVQIVGGSLEEAIQQGVREGYASFRKSIVADALFDRRNTRDNTPAVIHLRLVPGAHLDLHLAEKGYGSENKSFMTMYPYPQGGEDAVVEVIRQAVERAGADWCPPGILGVAVGGNFESAPLLAKRALLQPFDMDHLLARQASAPESLSPAERLRLRIFETVNGIGIGPQGLGGTTTVLDVKLVTAPTHLAGLPIAVNVQCNKMHHQAARLDGSGPVLELVRPDPTPFLVGLEEEGTAPRRIHLPLDPATRASLRAGERLLLSGPLLTGRDAAHRRLVDALERGEALPVDLRGQLIYYVGPVDPVAGEVVGPAGPTTASRMDPYTPRLLRESGLAGTIGKGERGPAALEAFREQGAVHLIATGGAAYLQARSVRRVEVLAYEDLGPEAIRVFHVEDFPVVVAVDASGTNLHQVARAAWAQPLRPLFGG